MPQEQSPSSSGYLMPGNNAIPLPCQQADSLSAFDYEQMCLALVMVARRIRELKAAEAQDCARSENQ